MDEHELELDEIEAAYLAALETAEAAEAYFPEVEISESVDSPVDNIDPLPQQERNADAHQIDLETEDHEDNWTDPKQVVEALLFVGGDPLPAKKIGDVLGSNWTHEQVDELIEQLGERYASQNRPYEIRLVQGGYQMTLRPEFEPVRRRVFGQGPKDVKLAQEALEILAFVAYKQPCTKEDVLETEKKNAAGLLRQLLRRQLIELERTDDGQVYRTTPRFLQVFGLGDIDDLPLAEDLSFK